MKPAISFVLQLSSSTAYENLEAVARNLLDGLDVLLNSGNVKCSVYMDGPTIEMLRKVARPLAFGRIRDGVNNGVLEFLGGGYHDSMLPLFPEEMQTLQLDSHRRLLNKFFDVEPQGYFNSSLVWEMGMTAVLERSGFDYALVSEAAIQDALGRSTPISGWYTIEDKGALMRIVPVADSLSRAIENDDLNWKEIAEPYCRDGKSAVVVLDIPPESAEIVSFFERLVDFVEMNEVQTRPVSFAVNQLPTDGSLSYLISAGRNIGLPATARTCRELLIRRPEVNMLQKSFLHCFHQAKTVLGEKDFGEFCESLFPMMSPIFFRDLGNVQGMKDLKVREWASRYLSKALKKLDALSDFSGLKIDVCDFLLQGRKQIWVENSDMAGLLDFYAGGVLRSLVHKPSSSNLLNAWRDDGEPSLAFVDCLLPNADLTPVQIELALAGHENILVEPYEYQIKRQEGSAEIQLLEEQGFNIGDKHGVFHVSKNFEFKNSSTEFSANYVVSNSVYLESKCFFGTILELGMLGKSRGEGLCIDGARIKWDRKEPILYPDAKTMDIHDANLGCTLHLKFDAPASVFVGPIFGASTSAAPEAFQGIRVYPFWRTALNVTEEKEFRITVSVSKR